MTTAQPKPPAEEPAIVTHLRDWAESPFDAAWPYRFEYVFARGDAERVELLAWLKSVPEPSERTACKHKNARMPAEHTSAPAWCPDCGALKMPTREWLTPDPFKLRAHEIETLRSAERVKVRAELEAARVNMAKANEWFRGILEIVSAIADAEVPCSPLASRVKERCLSAIESLQPAATPDENCPECEGSGHVVPGSGCSACGGSGKKKRDEKAVPAGTLEPVGVRIMSSFALDEHSAEVRGSDSELGAAVRRALECSVTAQASVETIFAAPTDKTTTGPASQDVAAQSTATEGPVLPGSEDCAKGNAVPATETGGGETLPGDQESKARKPAEAGRPIERLTRARIEKMRTQARHEDMGEPSDRFAVRLTDLMPLLAAAERELDRENALPLSIRRLLQRLDCEQIPMPRLSTIVGAIKLNSQERASLHNFLRAAENYYRLSEAAQEKLSPRASDERRELIDLFRSLVSRRHSPADDADGGGLTYRLHAREWDAIKDMLERLEKEAPRPSDEEQEGRLKEISRLADITDDDHARAALIEIAAYLKVERNTKNV